MLRLNIKKKMKQNGFTYYSLSKVCNMSPNNLKSMVENKTKSIKYETIEILCYIFDCTPNDLLIFTEEK